MNRDLVVNERYIVDNADVGKSVLRPANGPPPLELQGRSKRIKPDTATAGETGRNKWVAGHGRLRTSTSAKQI
jgi:hypothetical protein